jgi:hypothetical protein
LTWDPVPGATGYSIVSGSLDDLRATGNYNATAPVCESSNQPGTTLTLPSPPPGHNQWFLIRVRTASGMPETYGSQLRDVGIGSVLAGC